MTNAGFLYCYAKRYHQYNVKIVLMRENWDDKDFDVKYAKYMQEYIRVKDKLLKGNLPDEKIEASLDGLKRRRLCAYHERNEKQGC
ncbi:MAG: hypothetical protein LBP29_02190 [Treponema sp.]|jgi:hypothetical protein|nr:hypothetical protein [Treponema sp.]